MKQVYGIWIPDSDTHFERQMSHNPIIDGKGTYQYDKYVGSLIHIKQFRHAVDIGAHVGLWTRMMQKHFDFVSAFEPLPIHQECFLQNVNLNKVLLYVNALSAAEEWLKINVPPSVTGGARVALEGEDGFEIEAFPLDSFDINDIDFIKIDVEGWEVPVIIGGEATIRREKPVMLIEQKANSSRYGQTKYAAVDILKSWGASVVETMGDDILLKWE